LGKYTLYNISEDLKGYEERRNKGIMYVHMLLGRRYLRAEREDKRYCA